jgi:hypothetical protein
VSEVPEQKAGDTVINVFRARKGRIKRSPVGGSLRKLWRSPWPGVVFDELGRHESCWETSIRGKLTVAAAKALRIVWHLRYR